MRNLVFILLIIFGVSFLTGCIEDEPIVDEDIYYTVTFLDIDGNVYVTKKVLADSLLEVVNAPEIDGYKFVGWDNSVNIVNSDMVIKPIYEEIIKSFTVTFMSNGTVVSTVKVNEGESATAPIVERVGYTFMGWDKDFSLVKEDLIVNAIWEEIIRYGSSYVEEFDFTPMSDYSTLLDSLDLSSSLSYTFMNVKDGGFRGTNELVYYNETHSFNTNIYGFEIAVDANNIVIERATKVSMPKGGFVLSAHGTSATLLEDKTKTGDIIKYDNNTAKVYRSISISNTLSLGIDLNRLKEEVINSNNEYIALDYVLIQDTFNEVVGLYNNLIINYNYNDYKLASELALSIDFMLVEPTSTTVRAMWHYPLRASGYSESNLNGVVSILDKVKELGINRIYLNTNFNGKAIYKSDYLITTLTNYNTYGDYKDYLECFIEEAHKRGIEVFAWTNTLIAGDGVNNPWYSSRGWVLKGINGEDNHSGMYFVDISNDEVVELLKNVHIELANYGLDGIEYDFIRYPSGNLHSYKGVITDIGSVKDWGYNEGFISKFILEYNLTVDINDFINLIKSDEQIRKLWLDFKRNLLTETVELLSTSSRSVNPDILISAAVMPSITGAKNTYLQDWETWIASSYVDILEPMIYTADNNHLKNTIIDMQEVVGDYASIVAGIFPEGSGGASFMNASQIRVIEELGIAGSAKFSSKTIFSGFLKNSMEYMARGYIVLPTSSSEDIFDAYINDLKDKIKYYYRFRIGNDSLNHMVVQIDLLNNNENIEEAFSSISDLINSIENETIRKRLENEHLKISKYI